MLKTPLLLCLLAVCSASLASDGGELFEANGCGACHHPEKDRTAQGLGPSLAQIGKAYRGQVGELIAFLRGNAEPKLYPDKYRLMKAQLPRVMSLTDAKLRSLANHMLEN